MGTGHPRRAEDARAGCAVGAGAPDEAGRGRHDGAEVGGGDRRNRRPPPSGGGARGGLHPPRLWVDRSGSDGDGACRPCSARRGLGPSAARKRRQAVFWRCGHSLGYRPGGGQPSGRSGVGVPGPGSRPGFPRSDPRGRAALAGRRVTAGYDRGAVPPLAGGAVRGSATGRHRRGFSRHPDPWFKR